MLEGALSIREEEEEGVYLVYEVLEGEPLSIRKEEGMYLVYEVLEGEPLSIRECTLWMRSLREPLSITG